MNFLNPPLVGIIGVFVVALLLTRIFRKRRVSIALISVIAALAILVLSQKPWRSPESLHFVDSFFGSNFTISVAQISDGHGLNSTYVLVDTTNGFRKWYPIGNDDYLWYRVKMAVVSNELHIGSVAKPISTVNLSNFTVRWFGYNHSPTYVESIPK